MNTLFDPNIYSFSWFSVPIAAVGFVVLAIGFFILKQNISSVHNFSFFLLCLSVFIWLTGYGWIYSVTDPAIAHKIYRRYTFLGVSFIAASIYFFSAVWLNLWRQQKKFVFFSHALFLTFYLLAASTNLVVPYMDRYYWGFYSRYDWVGILFFICFIVFFALSFINFAYRLIRPIARVSKKQISAIIVAFCIAFIATIDFVPKLIHIEIYPFGYICAFFWILTVAYSIIKYKVMDIETAVHRTVFWMVTSAIVVLPVLGVFYLLNNWYQSLNSVFFALAISALFFIFFFYLKAVQPHIDHLFKRRELDLERTLIRFNDALVQLKDLTELSNYIVLTIRDVLYVDKVQVFLKHAGGTSLIRIDAEADAAAEPSYENKFIRWLEEKDNVALAEFVEIDPWFERVKDSAKSFFEQLDVQVTVPLVLNHELIGLINLGRKANFKSFRAPEIAFLSGLRRPATIALSNSLRLIEMQESLRQWNEQLEEKVRLRTQELEEAQKQLIQAEKLATLGTLAGGVAHEINNPLTAVLTNAQLLKMDAKDMDMESLNLIEEGAKRCQSIVQKLMKYARKPLSEDKSKEVDLNSVIENTLAFVGYQLEQENVRLIKHLNPVSKIKGLANELEQVFTNLILNAKDAVKSAKSTGFVEIKTFERNGSVCASIKDDGAGIPQEHLSKIFDPFFTTKEIGKGTGLGLSISYGIIEKHGGKIKVLSTEGKGSNFIVTLPKSYRTSGEI